MTLQLLFCGLVFVVCALSGKLANKIGVPVLLLFILSGMIFGSDGIFHIPFDNFQFAEQICSVALLFIMFYGGFGTNWKSAKPVALQSGLLASLGVVLTAALTGVFCHFALGFEWLESLLIGSVISSTDAASVFSILRSRKLNLKHGLASLLEIESGSNDPTAYTMTVIVLALMSGREVSIWYLAAAQIGIGALCGAVIAVGASQLLQRLRFKDSGLYTILVIAIALLAYSVPTLAGGNGYLSVYIVGIVLGNSNIRFKAELVHFFDGMTWIMQIAVFFLLGLLSFPSQIPASLPSAIGIALFLTFIARPVVVFSILSWFKVPIRQQLLVSWSGLRGAASIVFAISAFVSDAYTKSDIFHIVFCVALLSVFFQGTLLPVFAKKLGLVDDRQSVLKTFNDYQEQSMLQLVEMPMSPQNPWVGHKLRCISMPSNSIVVLVKRGDEMLIPGGETKIQADDTLILSCEAYQEEADIHLAEKRISRRHPWVNKRLKEVRFPEHSMVIMIRRGNQAILPKGDTKILCDDVLVFYDVSRQPELQKV
ncbi:MAG: potassium/proton antiporter [Clostridiales bacterium]|nr:potassium/proton antiporter [Clostridiales bacterium]